MLVCKTYYGYFRGDLLELFVHNWSSIKRRLLPQKSDRNSQRNKGPDTELLLMPHNHDFCNMIGWDKGVL